MGDFVGVAVGDGKSVTGITLVAVAVGKIVIGTLGVTVGVRVLVGFVVAVPVRVGVGVRVSVGVRLGVGVRVGVGCGVPVLVGVGVGGRVQAYVAGRTTRPQLYSLPASGLPLSLRYSVQLPLIDSPLKIDSGCSGRNAPLIVLTPAMSPMPVAAVSSNTTLRRLRAFSPRRQNKMADLPEGEANRKIRSLT